MIDVCYFLGRASRYDNWEIRYSIRSVEKNFKNLGKIWIIGQCPDFINKNLVNYISFPDEPTQNKDRNLIQKLVYLGGESQLTEEFIMNSDDHFIINPVDISKFTPYIESTKFPFNKNSLWIRRMERTKSTLLKFGYTQWNYDTHIPHKINKSHCRELLKFNFDGVGMCVFTLYFNTLLNDPSPNVITKEVRMELRADWRRGLKEIVSGDFAIVNDRSAGKKDVINRIESLFPTPSKYEI